MESSNADCFQQDDAYCYSANNELLSQGAEARIFRCTYLGKSAVVKERFSKKYRHPLLDGQLTRGRMKAELKAILKCREIGIDVPAVYFVDGVKNRIIMEEIPGRMTVRDYIENCRLGKTDGESCFFDQMKSLAESIGILLAKLHGINVIHGDLTTSNMMLRNGCSEMLVIIDFGLSSGKATIEDKGVDLFVLEKALLSTHPNSERIFTAILDSYRTFAGKPAENVIRKLDEIRMRGRKREMTG